MIQYQVVITPLIDFWSDSEPSSELRAQALDNLQAALVEVAGEGARWEETAGTGGSPATLDVAALYALRAAAAWYESHGNIDDFEASDAPWDHPIFDTFDEGARAQLFRHLLESDAEVAMFLPCELPDVYFLSEHDDEGYEDEFAVGSLATLLRELDTFAVVLQVPAGLDPYDSDTPAFDQDVAAHASANWGLTLLRRKAHQALKAKVPLILYAVELEEG